MQVSGGHRQAGGSTVLLLGIMARHALQLLPQCCQVPACLRDQDLSHPYGMQTAL